MTLLLGLVNRQQAILVSDRRLSVNGRVVEDDSNKAGILVCRDAHVAFGFTGLAQDVRFVTRRWLTEALMESVEPDSPASTGPPLAQAKTSLHLRWRQSISVFP